MLFSFQDVVPTPRLFLNPPPPSPVLPSSWHN